MIASGFFFPFFKSSMAWGLEAIAASMVPCDHVTVRNHLIAALRDDRLGRFSALDHSAQDFSPLVRVQLAAFDTIDELGKICWANREIGQAHFLGLD